MNLCQMMKYFHHNPAFDIEPKKDDRLLPVVFFIGAGNEIRTRDICLGKATLYH